MIITSILNKEHIILFDNWPLIEVNAMALSRLVVRLLLK
jgi:hypothetical protein